MNNRRKLVIALGAVALAAPLAAAQQDYPNKPIRFIVPFPPGGSTDPVARLIGQKLTESWGQQVIVDNRPGGNTIIGTEALAKSAPDGYTMSLATSTFVISPHLVPSLPYDSFKDFAPVATLASSEFVLVLNASVPANNLQEFIALAKSRPGGLNCASTGTGSANHLASEFFNMLAGIKTQHIPYKGGGPALTDLLGGLVQMAFNPPLAYLPHIKTGRLKAIAISGESRHSSLPQVPTFTEAGLPGYSIGYWIGVLAPTGTPKAIIDKLSTEIGRILAMPDTKEKIAVQGMDSFISSPEQFAALTKADMAKWGKVIKAAGIKPD